MMRWKKLGRLYVPEGETGDKGSPGEDDRGKSGAPDWRKLYGILPTPVSIPERDAIRIYFAATAEDRIGRIFSMTVDAADPSRILEPAADPLLGPGSPGAFDDCGVNPSSVVTVNGRLHLYYIGYQRSVMSPYLLFTGLATSDDGLAFQRHANVPVFDRTSAEYIVRSAPTVLEEDGAYRAWYVSASGWERMTAGIFAGRMMPVYVIRHARSRDGIDWTADAGICIGPQNDDEFGFGRPWVVRDGNRYRMFYSRRTRSTPYRIGYAESDDGIRWTRMDAEVGIEVSDEGWDSEMICYAAVVTTRHGTVMFYNGNRNGETGFGAAILI